MIRKSSLILLVVLSLIISIIPPITSASPLTGGEAGPKPGNASIIAYTTYGNYFVYVYGIHYTVGGDVYLLVLDNTGNIVAETIFNTNVGYGLTDADANDTGVLAAYYHYSSEDIQLVWFDYTGTYTYIGAFTDTDTAVDEDNPVVGYGANHWLIGFRNDTEDTFVVTICDLNFNIKAREEFSIGRYGGVDYRERVIYDPITNRFYIVLYDSNAADLKLVIADPSTYDIIITSLTNDGATTKETYPSYGLMYRRFYAKLLGSGGKLLVVYGYYSGSTNITGLIVDLTTSPITITKVTIDTEGGDSNFYPWIATSGNEWLVVWSYNNNIYARIVYPDGTLSSKWILAMGQYGYITAVYNGIDYTIIYGNQTAGNYDLYVIRLDTTGKRSPSPLVIASTSADEAYEYPLAINGAHSVLFLNESDSKTYYVFFDRTEVPEPTAIPTELQITNFIVDDGGDTYVEAGDTITVEGVLKDTSTGLGIPGATIKVSLHRYIYYNTKTRHDEDIVEAEVTGTTDANGAFSITLTIPNTIIAGIYYVTVEYPGEDPYAPASWSSVTEYGYIPMVNTKPATITWEPIPTEIAKGPALLIKNGQVIITDPVDEVSTNYRFDTVMTDILGDEVDDVDIASMELTIDQNYLYVKAEFAGDATASGDIAPVLAMVFDFTPENLDDGYRYYYTFGGEPIEVGRLLLIYKMGYSDTYLKDNTAWHVILIATPRDYRGYVFSDMPGRYTLYMYIAFEEGGQWYLRELVAGYVVLNGNTMEIYAPLDVIKTYNPYLMTTGIVSWKMFSAVYAVDLATGKAKGAPGANWFDVPGVVTYNSTPTDYLELGIWESPLDDKYGYDYELDTFFILNIDWSTNKFFGYTKLQFVKTYVDLTRFGRIEYDKAKAFMGTNTYVVKLVDANNTVYGVYGKAVELLVDGVVEGSTTSSIVDNVVGIAELQYKWLDNMLGTEHNISFRFNGDADYIGTVSIEYSVKPVYLADIVSGTATLINNDDIPTVSQGDIIKIELVVDVWYDDWIPAPVGLKFKVYLNSTPYYLGEAEVVEPGYAVLTYTVTGEEGLYDYNYTEHQIIIYRDPDTTWIATGVAVVLDFPYSLGMIPTPEPTILPLILLGILLILFLIKKK